MGGLLAGGGHPEGCLGLLHFIVLDFQYEEFNNTI